MNCYTKLDETNIYITQVLLNMRNYQNAQSFQT